MSSTCRYTTTGDLECIYNKIPTVIEDKITFKSPMLTETFEQKPSCTDLCNGANAACISFQKNLGKCV